MRTEIDLPNLNERLYPGTYAEVSLEMNRRPGALTVPATAVGADDDGNFCIPSPTIGSHASLSRPVLPITIASR